MANPTASAAVTPSNPAPGQTITLTVSHSDVDRYTLTVSGVVTDSQGNTGPWSAEVVVDRGVVSITNAGGKTWTLVSETDNQAVFTTTA